MVAAVCRERGENQALQVEGLLGGGAAVGQRPMIEIGSSFEKSMMSRMFRHGSSSIFAAGLMAGAGMDDCTLPGLG